MNLRTETYALAHDYAGRAEDSRGEYRQCSSCETTKHMPVLARVLLLLRRCTLRSCGHESEGDSLMGDKLDAWKSKNMRGGTDAH